MTALPGRSTRPTGRILLVTGLLLLAACSRPLPVPESLLLVTLDTTRADHLSCYSSEAGPTPHMDRLAREGALFQHCRTCSPLTLPSHASIMTGLYPTSHGIRRNATRGLDPAFETLAEVLRARGWKTRAIVASFVLNRMFGLDQGFQQYSDVAVGSMQDPLRAERRGDEVRQEAVRALGELKGSRFFLWVHFYDPHHPYLTRSGEARDDRAAYRDEISFMDDQIGLLLDELDRIGLRESTLIAVVGDHGEGLGDHQEATHGYFLYDSTLLVPLLLSCPGSIPEGRVVASEVRTIDLAPTLLDLLQQPNLPVARGTSLRPLVTGEEKDLGLAAYAESYETQVQFGLAPLKCLVQDGWKYIHAPRPELFATGEDPDESHDRLGARTDVGADLRGRLEDLLSRPLEIEGRGSGEVNLAEREREALDALGYLAAGTAPSSEGLSSLQIQGGDPKDFRETIQRFLHARGAAAAGRMSQARRSLEKVLEELPDAPEAKLEMIRILRRARREEDAIRWCREILTDDPDRDEIRIELAQLLSMTGRFDEALEPLEPILRGDPLHSRARYEAGVILARSGRREEAVSLFEEALSLEPRNARYLSGLATTKGRLGLYGEALELFRRALEIDPDCAVCRQGYETARRRLQDPAS